MEQEEGVLKDVLDELDRERTRRAELELQVQQLEQENQRLRLDQHDQLKKDQIVSYGDFTAMKAEANAYREIIDALTLGKPAIAAAAQAEHIREATSRRTLVPEHKPKDEANQAKTLPLHVVRLLEVLPWQERAKQHVVVVEQIFEWQVYKEQSWQSQWKFFPTLFKTLRSQENSHNNNAFLQILSGADLQTKRNKQQRILTDEKLSILYETDSGFPLPTDGGEWEWIGAWRIQKDHDEVPVDANGWSYVEQPRDFASHKSETPVAFNDPGTDEKSPMTFARPFRRRKWVRQRNLVNYPLASESTQQYLRLLADTARLQIVTAKINEQLIQTKSTLTETEERLVQAKNDGTGPTSSMLPSEEVMEEQNDTKQLEQELVGGESSSTIEKKRSTPIIDRHHHPMDKFSMWMQQQHQNARKASEDITLSDDSGTEDGLGTDSTHSDSTTQRSPNTPFDWKKLGRHQIMQKLKRNHGSSRRIKTFRTPIVLDTPEEDDDLML